MPKKTKLRPAAKTHGGKYYITDFIIESFPENYEELTYCELFCGGGSVYLNKNASVKEVINDIDSGSVYIFKALRDEPKEFIDRLKRVRYTQRAFDMALKKSQNGQISDYIDMAINEYMLRRMSRGGMKEKFAWSERQRGGKPGDLNAWETMLKQLPSIAERVKNTTILNCDFLDLMKIWDEEETFLYLDPPYLPDTRAKNSQNVYKHEMTVEQHIEMLNYAVKSFRGKVMISGYNSSLYNRILKGWRTKKKEIVNHSSQAKKKDLRIEMIWMNY